MKGDLDLAAGIFGLLLGNKLNMLKPRKRASDFNQQYLVKRAVYCCTHTRYLPSELYHFEEHSSLTYPQFL